MLFRETVAVYCENHTEHINTLCNNILKFIANHQDVLTFFLVLKVGPLAHKTLSRNFPISLAAKTQRHDTQNILRTSQVLATQGMQTFLMESTLHYR
jgi:hypothetical protein